MYQFDAASIQERLSALATEKDMLEIVQNSGENNFVLNNRILPKIF